MPRMLPKIELIDSRLSEVLLLISGKKIVEHMKVTQCYEENHITDSFL